VATGREQEELCEEMQQMRRSIFSSPLTSNAKCLSVMPTLLDDDFDVQRSVRGIFGFVMPC
jgi:hypothetical protein